MVYKINKVDDGKKRAKKQYHKKLRENNFKCDCGYEIQGHIGEHLVGCPQIIKE